MIDAGDPEGKIEFPGTWSSSRKISEA